MVANQKQITGELCGIIEQFMLADVNDEVSTFYPRKSGVKFSPNDSTIARFDELLATPGLNVNVSTSKKNSLLAHTVMFGRLLVEDANKKAQARVIYAPKFRRTRHLIDLMAQHPSVDINSDRVTYDVAYFSYSYTSDLLIYQILDELCLKNQIAPWQSVFDRVVVDSKFHYIATWYLMAMIDDVTAKTIVNNAEFDPTATADNGATILGTVIAHKHCEAVEDMLKMEKCLPNQLTPASHMLFDLAAPTSFSPWVHPVLHAAMGFKFTDPRPPTKVTKRLVRVLLAHEKTDISLVRPPPNGKWAININSMMQLLDHDTVDIHNLVIMSENELAIQAAPPEDEDMDSDEYMDFDEEEDVYGDGEELDYEQWMGSETESDDD